MSATSTLQEVVATLQFACDADELAKALRRAAIVPPEGRTADHVSLLVVTVEADHIEIWSNDQVRFVRVAVRVTDLSGPHRTFAYPVRYVAGLRLAAGPMRWSVQFREEGVFITYDLEDGTHVEHATCAARSDSTLRKAQSAARPHGQIPASMLREAISTARSVMPATDDRYTDQRHRSLTIQPPNGDAPAYVFAGDGKREIYILSAALNPVSQIVIRDSHIAFILKFLEGLQGDVNVSENDHHLFLEIDGALLGVGRWTLPPPRPRRDREELDDVVVRIVRKDLVRVLTHARSEVDVGYVRIRIDIDTGARTLALRATWSGGGRFVAAPLSLEVSRARRPTIGAWFHLDHLLESVDAGVSDELELRLLVPNSKLPELVLGRIVEDVDIDVAGLVWDPKGKIPKHRRDPIKRIQVVRTIPCMNPI